MLRTHNLCPETKMFLTSGKNIFCFRAAKFVSAPYVSHFSHEENNGKHLPPQQCFRNNVSQFSQALKYCLGNLHILTYLSDPVSVANYSAALKCVIENTSANVSYRDVLST